MNQNNTRPRQAETVSSGRPERAAWMQKKNRELKLLRIGIVTVCLLTVLVALLLLILPSLKVREIEVEFTDGSKRISVQTVIDATGVSVGDEILSVDLNAVMARIKEKCPDIKVESVSVTPTKLKIRVSDRAVMTVEYAGRWFALAEDLTVLSESAGKDQYAALLTVNLPDIYEIKVGESVRFLDGQTDRSYIAEAIDFLRENELLERATLLDVSEKFNISYVLDGTLQVRMGRMSDLEHKLEMVEQILERRGGVNEFAVIDVSDPERSTYRPLNSAEFLLKQ
jgi:hypothetical protein